MVAKGNILTAKREIEAAFEGFAAGGAETKVFVFETEWQHLRAMVGSNGFRDVGLSERQKMVWSYLQAHVSKESLLFLMAVHPMDLDAYELSVREV